MTEKHARELIAAWQQRLGLTEWSIKVRIGVPETSGAHAEIDRLPNYKRARITVHPYVVEQADPPPEDNFDPVESDEEAEAVFVHELLHCHTIGMRTVVSDRLEGRVHRDVHQILDETMSAEEERAVDGLARALVKAWPRGLLIDNSDAT